MGSFRGKLQILMPHRGMDAQKLHEATGIPASTIRSYSGEGRPRVPKPYRALLLAKALDVSLDRLADDDLEDSEILSPRIIQTERGRDLSPPKKRAQ
jgi:transcriptional regulator with XRE-family HTH domain